MLTEIFNQVYVGIWTVQMHLNFKNSQITEEDILDKTESPP